jgi:hypothetical protein
MSAPTLIHAFLGEALRYTVEPQQLLRSRRRLPAEPTVGLFAERPDNHVTKRVRRPVTLRGSFRTSSGSRWPDASNDGGMVMTFMNEGVWDRVIRILAGIALGYAACMTWPASIMSGTGTVSLVFLGIGAIAFVTGSGGLVPGVRAFQCFADEKSQGVSHTA